MNQKQFKLYHWCFLPSIYLRKNKFPILVPDAEGETEMSAVSVHLIQVSEIYIRFAVWHFLLWVRVAEELQKIMWWDTFYWKKRSGQKRGED